MSVPATPPQDPPSSAPERQRAADLSELLGHVSNCWDNERRSLSRQLHDSLGSSLTALTMHLGMLAHKLPDDPDLQGRAAQMKQLLHNIIDVNRQMQSRLWNDKFEFLGVSVALRSLVEEFSEQQPQLQTSCCLPGGEPDCPSRHGLVLLRALEEGLSNVVAHAAAGSVEVRLEDLPGAIVLSVRDDGAGLREQQRAGFGLRVVRERAHDLGGSLILANHPDGGACLTLSLPKPAPRTAA